MSWMKHTRWLLPVGAWVLLLLFTGAFYYLIIPCFIGHFEVLGIVIAIAEVLVFFAVVANSLTATFMDPGVIPRASSSEELQHNEHRVPAYILVDVNDITVHLKWCFTCHIYRPPRCSHCSVCDHCVDTLDHHCPWINNCVGRRNYRSFFLFLLVVPAHSVFLFLICFVYTLHTRDDLSTKDNIASILLMVITAAFFMTVIGLTSYHVFLVAFGRTTNEQIHGKYRGGYNPFNKGLLLNVVTVCCAPKFPSFTDYVGRQVMPEEVVIEY